MRECLRTFESAQVIADSNDRRLLGQACGCRVHARDRLERDGPLDQDSHAWPRLRQHHLDVRACRYGSASDRRRCDDGDVRMLLRAAEQPLHARVDLAACVRGRALARSLLRQYLLGARRIRVYDRHDP